MVDKNASFTGGVFAVRILAVKTLDYKQRGRYRHPYLPYIF